jgi:hypothetical protein
MEAEMRLAIITGFGLGLFLCAAAFASDFTYFGGDTLELSESTEGHAAELHYVNAAERASSFGTAPILSIETQYGTIEVMPHISIGHEQAERLTVNVLTEGYIAMPEVVDVPDGSDVVVQIGRAMF